MEWISDLGFAGLFMLGVAAFLLLGLAAGALTLLGKAGAAFKRGWDKGGD